MKTMSKEIARRTRSNASSHTSEVAVASVFDPQAKGGEACMQRFLPEANALPKEGIVPLRVSISLLRPNVERGVAAVLTERDRVAKELGSIDISTIESLPDLARGVVYAATRVVRRSTFPNALVARGRVLRTKLLATADALVLSDVFDSASVASIRKERGMIAMAMGLGALAGMYRDHAAAIQGHTTITQAEVEEASTVSDQLLTAITPKRAVRTTKLDAVLAEQLEERDRLFTLLNERYDIVLRAGLWLFGPDNGRVPSLRAMAHVHKPSPPKGTTSSPTTAPATSPNGVAAAPHATPTAATGSSAVVNGGASPST